MVVIARTASGIEVSTWELFTGVQDLSGPSIVQDFDVVTQVSTPFYYDSLSHVNSNTNLTSYSHWWIADAGPASFHTAYDQRVASADVRINSTSDIRFIVTENVTLSALGSLTYSHTPGDENRVDFYFFLSNLTAGGVLANQLRQGGADLMLPSSGTLEVGGEYDLIAGHLYRLHLRSELFGTSFQPTGPFDANGFIQVTIMPEPATALFLLAAAPLALRRPRR